MDLIFRAVPGNSFSSLVPFVSGRQEESFTMWNKRKLLLAAIFFITLYCKGTAEVEKELDMAPNSVDNRYEDCREQALEKFVHSGLLKEELNRSEPFMRLWNQTQCEKKFAEGTPDHMAALMAYTSGNTDLKRNFDKAVKTSGGNVSIYENDFHFKSLQFLLMDAITLLNPKQCKTVYYLPDDKYMGQKGSEVRLGKFIISYSNYSDMEDTDLAGQVTLRIYSCFYANLELDSCIDKGQVLLSPAEVFVVEDEQEKYDENDEKYKEIFLKHSKMNSPQSCDIFSRSPADVSAQWLVLLLVALSPFFFDC